MPQSIFNLALELSTPHAQVALGRGDDIIAVADLPERKRSNLELMPTIDALCRAHDVGPRDIAECYVSLGPGSFTGLRVAVATAHMLAFAMGTKLVGVPTLDILLAQHPGHAVALNLKHHTAWSAWSHTTPPHADAERSPRSEASGTPAFRTLDELIALGLPLVMDLPEHLKSKIKNQKSKIPLPLAATLHRLARAKAARTGYDDPPAPAPGSPENPGTLQPLYLRDPEAVTLWNQRHGPA